MEWLLISSAVFVLILLGVGIYQFLWRNIRDFFREVGILLRNMSVNFFQREVGILFFCWWANWNSAYARQAFSLVHCIFPCIL